jgi:hypothetical protein
MLLLASAGRTARELVPLAARDCGHRGRTHPRSAARRFREQSRHAPRERPTRQNPRKLAQALIARCRKNPRSPRSKSRAPASSISSSTTTPIIARSSTFCRPGRLRPLEPRRGTIGAGGIRLGESDRAAARRPRPPCRLRRDARNLLEAVGYRVAARVLRQRCRPANGHSRGQHLAAISRALRRALRVSRERLSRRLHRRDRR